MASKYINPKTFDKDTMWLNHAVEVAEQKCNTKRLWQLINRYERRTQGAHHA